MSGKSNTYFFQLSLENCSDSTKNLPITFPFDPKLAILTYAREFGLEVDETNLKNFSIAIFDSNDNYVDVLNERSHADIIFEDKGYHFVLKSKDKKNDEGIDEFETTVFYSAQSECLLQGMTVMTQLNGMKDFYEQRILKYELSTHELCLYSSISFLQRQFAVFSIPLSKITAVTPIHAKPSLQQLDNTPYGLLMRVEEKDIDLYFDSMYKFDEVFEVVSSFVWKGKLAVELKETPSDGLLAFYWQRIEEYTAKMQGHYKEIAVCNLKALVESKIYDSHFGILPENLELALLHIQQLNEDKLQYAGKENEYEGIACNTLPIIETDLKFLRKETFSRIIELINECKERILPYFVASQLVDIFESNELDYNEKSIILHMSLTNCWIFPMLFSNLILMNITTYLMPSHCNILPKYTIELQARVPMSKVLNSASFPKSKRKILPSLKDDTVFPTQNQNRFKFKPFSEQLENLEINIFKDSSKITNSSHVKDDTFSYFYEGLEYWHENNLSQDFESFFLLVIRRINPNLATILHCKDFLAESLLDGLKDENSYALISFLNLSCLLAKDLVGEFYHPFGLKFFSRYRDLLKISKDPQIIEAIFFSITYMFKFLTKEIVNDFPAVFDILSTLLFFPHEKNEFNRNFISDALGFLIKRSPSETLTSILSTLVGNEEVMQFTENLNVFSSIIFNAIKSIKGNLNSKSKEIMHCFLEQIDFHLKPIVILHLMENLQTHFIENTASFNDCLRLYLFPMLQSNFFSFNVQNLEEIFVSFRKMLKISKGGLLKSIIEIFISWYIPLSGSLDLEKQALGMEFLILLISSASLQEILEFKLQKIIGEFLFDRPVNFTLWALYSIFTRTTYETVFKSCLDVVNLEQITCIDQLALLKQLHYDDIELKKLLLKFSAQFSINEFIYFQLETDYNLIQQCQSLENIENPVCLQYLSDCNVHISEEYLLALIPNLSHSDFSKLRIASLQLMNNFASINNDALLFQITTELMNCQKISLTLSSLRKKLLYLRNVVSLINSNNISPVHSRVVSEYVFGEIFLRFSLYRKDLFKIIGDLVAKCNFNEIWNRKFIEFSIENTMEYDEKCNFSYINFNTWLKQWYKKESLGIDQEFLATSFKFIQLLDLIATVPVVCKDFELFSSFFIKHYRSHPILRKNLSTCFAFFSQLSGINSIELFRVVMDALCFQDSDVQESALKTLFVFHKSLIKFTAEEMEILKNLVNDETFKDELLLISLDESKQSRMPPKSRANLIPFIIRILFGKIGKKFHRSGMNEIRRKIIFQFFSTCSIDESRLLFDLIFESFQCQDIDSNNTFSISDSSDFMYVWDHDKENSVTEKQCYGTLNNIQQVISKIGNCIRDDSHIMIRCLNCIIYCIEKVSSNPKVKSMALKRLHEFFSLDLPLFDPRMIERFYEFFIESHISTLNSNNAILFVKDYFQSENSAFIILLDNWSLNPRYHTIFSSNLVQLLAKCIGFEYVAVNVKEKIIEILSRLLSQYRIHTVLIFENIFAFVKSIQVSQVKKFDKILRLIVGFTKTANIHEISSDNFSDLAVFLCELLGKSYKVVFPQQKCSILEMIEVLSKNQTNTLLVDSIFENLTNFIYYSTDLNAQAILARIFSQFSSEFTSAFLTKSSKIDDIDARINCLVTLKSNVDKFYTVSQQEWRSIIFAIFHIIRFETDFVLKSNASNAILAIIRSKECNEHVISYILSMIRTLLKSEIEGVFSECHLILQDLIHCSCKNDLSFLSQFKLFEISEESNYFCNIFHLQNLFRVRAVCRLGQWVKSNNVPVVIFTDYFLPVLHWIIFNSTSEPNLIAEATNTVGIFISSSMESFKFISFYFKLLKKDTEKKPALKIIEKICSQVSCFEEKEDFANYLNNYLFPVLQSYLIGKRIAESSGKNSFKVSMAVSMAYLLKQCGEVELNEKLPQIIFFICNNLKSRESDVCNSARATLSKIFQLLGPNYANFLFKELGTVLNRGGFHNSVLSRTIWSLLENVNSLGAVGIKTLFRILFPLADYENQKLEALTNDARIPKSKFKKAILIFERVAQISSDVESFEEFRCSFDYFSQTIRNKKLLHQIVEAYARGLGKNVNLSKKLLLSISYVLLTKSESSEMIIMLSLVNLKVTLKNIISSNDFIAGKNDLEVILEKSTETQTCNDNSLVDTDAIQPNTEFINYEDALIPFLKILPHLHTRTKDLDLIKKALDCLELIYLKLKGKSLWIIAMSDPETIQFLFEMTTECNPNVSNRLALFSSCVKLLTRLLENNSYNIANFEEKLKSIIILIANNGILRYDAEIKSVLSLIYWTIRKEIVFAELFDIVEKQIFSILISHHLPTIRKSARQLFLRYLVKYPITSKRLQHILCELIIKNMDYSLEEGRLSCLELLQNFLNSINIQSIGESVEFVYLNLVMQLANQDSSKCKELIGSCVLVFITNALPVQRFGNSLAKLTQKFLLHSDTSDSNHSLILLGILLAISYAPKSFISLIDTKSITAVIVEVFPSFPIETMTAIERLFLNEMILDDILWTSVILKSLLELEHPQVNIGVKSQLNIISNSILLLAPSSKEICMLCLNYASNPILINCNQSIAIVLVRFFQHFYHQSVQSTDSFCIWICKTLFDKFRMPKQDKTVLESLYLLTMRFFGGIVSIIEWNSTSQSLDTDVLFFLIKATYFVEVNRKRFSLSTEQFKICSEVVEMAKKSVPSAVFLSSYQQIQRETARVRKERKAKRKCERLTKE